MLDLSFTPELYLADTPTWLSWHLQGLLCVSVLGLEPAFDVLLLNVTVVSGQLAVLPCLIENIGTHKVR